MQSDEQDVLKRDVAVEEEIKTGPLSVLYTAVQTGEPILVLCRNDRKLCGRLAAFDPHFNLIMVGVEEIWTQVRRTDKGKARGQPVVRQRFIPKLFVRGDSVILVVKDPLRDIIAKQ